MKKPWRGGCAAQGFSPGRNGISQQIKHDLKYVSLICRSHLKYLLFCRLTCGPQTRSLAKNMPRTCALPCFTSLVKTLSFCFLPLSTEPEASPQQISTAYHFKYVRTHMKLAYQKQVTVASKNKTAIILYYFPRIVFFAMIFIFGRVYEVRAIKCIKICSRHK